MKTKINLKVERSIIQRAKIYAKNTGRSLSGLIVNYLEVLTQSIGKDNISPKLKKIVGAVKYPKNFDEEKELRLYFEKKHL